MIYTFIFGTRVGSDEHNYGTLQRVILNNGIANQFTVNPGLLGTERVVPISDVQGSNDDGLQLNAGKDEWNAYTAYKISAPIDNPNEDEPNMASLTPQSSIITAGTDTEHITDETGARTTMTTVSMNSVVLSASTGVVLEGQGRAGKLRGLIADTGRPQQLLLDDGSSVPFDAVTLLDENEIHVGGAHREPVLPSDRDTEHTASRAGGDTGKNSVEEEYARARDQQ